MNKIIKINKFRWTTHRIQPITSLKISVLLQIILYIYINRKNFTLYTQAQLSTTLKQKNEITQQCPIFFIKYLDYILQCLQRKTVEHVQSGQTK